MKIVKPRIHPIQLHFTLIRININFEFRTPSKTLSKVTIYYWFASFGIEIMAPISHQLSVNIIWSIERIKNSEILNCMELFHFRVSATMDVWFGHILHHCFRVDSLEIDTKKMHRNVFGPLIQASRHTKISALFLLSMHHLWKWLRFRMANRKCRDANRSRVEGTSILFQYFKIRFGYRMVSGFINHIN